MPAGSDGGRKRPPAEITAAEFDALSQLQGRLEPGGTGALAVFIAAQLWPMDEARAQCRRLSPELMFNHFDRWVEVLVREGLIAR